MCLAPTVPPSIARLTQLVLPAMRAAGQGRIINISSIGGKFYEPLGTWYHSTKFAVEGLSDALRLELKPHGVFVSIIEPASTLTEWGRVSVEVCWPAPDAVRTWTRQRSRCRRGPACRHFGKPQDALSRGQGRGAILALRRILPDGVYDAAVMAVLKRVAR